jgi:hypothetical protein
MSPMTLFIIAIIACIFSIATSAIGIKTMNDNDNYKKENGASFGFLVFNLVIAVLAMLAAVGGLLYKTYELRA